MSTPALPEHFVRELTNSQPVLHGFIFSLLPQSDAAQEVLQNTNVVLCGSAEKFVKGSNFLAWGCQIARHQVLAYVRDRGRDRHVFNNERIEQLASAIQKHSENSGRLYVYLQECLDLRSEDEQALLRERYSPGASVKEMAAERGVTPGSLYTTLCRLRHALTECIEGKLAAESR